MGGGPNTRQPPMPPQYRLPPPDSGPTRPRPIAPPPPMPVAPPPPPPEQRRPPFSFDEPRPVAPPPPPQRPLPISQGGKPILAPLPLRRSPIDMVRDPNYDAVMAQRNYENNLAQSIANSQLQNPPPPPMPSLGLQPNGYPKAPPPLSLELQPNGYPKAPPPPSLALQPNGKPKAPPLPKPGQFTQGRLMGAPSSQMDAYNNFLQQGIQGSNTRAF